MNKGIVFMGMGFEMMGIALGGFFLGSLIDAKLGWPGYGIALCVLLGFMGWSFHLYVLLKRFMKVSENDKHNNPH